MSRPNIVADLVSREQKLGGSPIYAPAHAVRKGRAGADNADICPALGQNIRFSGKEMRRVARICRSGKIRIPIASEILHHCIYIRSSERISS